MPNVYLPALFYVFAFPVIIVWGPAFYYTLALFDGLACARDVQHRMTPQSPWVFFRRGFKRRGRRFVLGVIPWCLIVSGVCAYAGLIWVRKSSVLFWSDFWEFLTFVLPDNLGVGLVALSLVGLLAPRSRSPLLVSALGTLGGLVPWVPVSWIAEELPFPWRDWGVGVGLPAWGLAWFVLSWLYIGRRLDRAWFRFEE